MNHSRGSDSQNSGSLACIIQYSSISCIGEGIRDARLTWIAQPAALVLISIASALLGSSVQPPAHAASTGLPRAELCILLCRRFFHARPAIGYDPFAWTGEHAIFEGCLTTRPRRAAPARSSCRGWLPACLSFQATDFSIHLRSGKVSISKLPSIAKSLPKTCATPSSARSRRIPQARP